MSKVSFCNTRMGMIKKFLVKFEEVKHLFRCANLNRFEHELVDHALRQQVAMAHKVVVGIFEHLNVFRRGDAFDHCLKV